MTLEQISKKFAENGYKLFTSLEKDGYFHWELTCFSDKRLKDPLGECSRKCGREKPRDLMFMLHKLYKDTI